MEMNCPKCGDPANFSKKRAKLYCAECELELESIPVDSASEFNTSQRTDSPLKLFLSYGRDDFANEVFTLRDALRKRGHEVWFDGEQLATGLDWEQRIEQGLKWCDKVVLTMTPHSVRRPDGYCLNEIAKALESQKIIIPVLLVELPNGAPTSICRIQYLDWRDAVPADQNAERFIHRLQRLCDAIENDKLDFEGGQQRLQRYLRPLNYDGDIRRHVSHFIGRNSLLLRIHDWLFDPHASQVLWLTGGPGLGKSAIAAWLSHRWAEAYAIHFCQSGNKDKSDAVKTILSIAYQLSQHLDLYCERLSHLDLENESCKVDVKTLFDTLLISPLSKDYPAPEKPCFVIIDGVDEATNQDNSNQLAELVATDWKKLPSWLKLVVSSRPDPEVQQWLGGIDSISLNGSDEEQQKDLLSYLDQQLKAIDKNPTQELLDQILKASEGTFHYIVLLLEDIKNGRCNPENPVELPMGMNSFYLQSFFRRFKNINEYKESCRPLLSLILASPEPLALQIIALAQNTGPFEIRERLQLLGSLISIEPAEDNAGSQWDTVRLAHASLGSWLTSLDERRMPLAQSFTVQPAILELTDTILALWEKSKSKKEFKVNPYTARNLWNLLQKTTASFSIEIDDRKYLSSEKYLFEIAISLMKYWQNKNSRLAMEPTQFAADFILNNLSALGFDKVQDFQNIKTISNLSSINRQLGNYESALTNLIKLVDVLEKANIPLEFVKHSSEILGQAYLDLGAIYTDLLNYSSAYEAYNKSLNIFKELSNIDPANEKYILDVCKVNYMIGGSYQAFSKLDDALIYYKKSQNILSSLLQSSPDQLEYKLESAGMHLWIGAILEIKGFISEAISEFTKANIQLTQLVESKRQEEEPEIDNDAEIEWYFTVSQQYLAGALELDNQMAEAASLYYMNMISSKKLLNRDSYNVSSKRELASSFANLAKINLLLNNLPVASDYLEQSYILFKQMKNPSDPGSEFDCAVVAAVGAEISEAVADSPNTQRFNEELSKLDVSSKGISVGLFRVRFCPLLIKRLRKIQLQPNNIDNLKISGSITGLEEWFLNIDNAMLYK